ncbi:CPBP family intramembrane glutamic endopeptidase [Aestuariivirga sp.]|uniref:CPBP family intramembrane glutamic endopeptidase n=1 Tax=Aestuariivirga sp. TaxID=2650926 RepID=UPI00391C6156
MRGLGEDFAGGWLRRLYWPVNPSGLWYAILAAIALVLLHQMLQAVLSLIVLKQFFGSDVSNTRELVKASLVAIFPASLAVALAGWWLAGRRGSSAAEVLALRPPKFTWLGWLVLILGFMTAMYLVIMSVVLVFGIDLAQYTPGPDGQSPKTGSAGLVKEAMFDIANEPLLFLIVFPSVALGAPIAEEVIFRGQLFSALSSTRLGVSGTTLVTSALWALLHMSEPWLSVGLIFVMGLVFGWMMYRFGSLWVTIACHGAWNGTYALIIFGSLGSGT